MRKAVGTPMGPTPDADEEAAEEDPANEDPAADDDNADAEPSDDDGMSEDDAPTDDAAPDPAEDAEDVDVVMVDKPPEDPPCDVPPVLPVVRDVDATAAPLLPMLDVAEVPDEDGAENDDGSCDELPMDVPLAGADAADVEEPLDVPPALVPVDVVAAEEAVLPEP